MSDTKMQCSQCLFFKHYPKDKQCCHEKGIRGFAEAQESCFVPDVSQLSINIDQFMSLVATLNSFNAKQLQIALSLIKNHTQKDRKYKLGQKVYIRVSGSDYLSNYRSAYVLGYMPDGNVILSGCSTLNSKGKNFLAFIDDNACLTDVEWEQKKDKLLNDGLITDPKSIFNESSAVEDFEPGSVPTIDTAPDHWYSKEEPVQKKKRKDSYDKLIEFA